MVQFFLQDQISDFLYLNIHLVRFIHSELLVKVLINVQHVQDHIYVINVLLDISFHQVVITAQMDTIVYRIIHTLPVFHVLNVVAHAQTRLFVQLAKNNMY
jgi:hypothetical protein